LWSTHQIDAFREATSSYLEKFRSTVHPERLAAPRLGIAVIGKGVEHNRYPLFRKLRPVGTYFTHVDPSDGLRILLEATAARATSYPERFGHWYVDGGADEPVSGPSLIRISYGGLDLVRKALLRRIDNAVSSIGPERLSTMLHKMRPEEIGLPGGAHEQVLSRFQASLLTEGSGTQIFSTTFVQWTTRELWRRAQPLTILARFAPRQRQAPLNELAAGKIRDSDLDPVGSLIDADMGAYYMWINQQRLSGAKEASFLVWFENHEEAVVISPNLPRNTQSSSPVDVRWLLAQVA
jgi:hypothetical protein